MSKSDHSAGELYTWTKAPTLVPGLWSFRWAFAYALIFFLLVECRVIIQLHRKTSEGWGTGPAHQLTTLGVSSLIIGVSAMFAYWQIKRITAIMSTDRVTLRAIMFYCLIVLGIVFTAMNLFLD